MCIRDSLVHQLAALEDGDEQLPGAEVRHGLLLPGGVRVADDEVLRVVHAVVVQADVVCLGHACVAAVEAVDLLEVGVRYLADVLAYLDARDDGAVVLLNGGELVNAVEDGGGAAGYEMCIRDRP